MSEYSRERAGVLDVFVKYRTASNRWNPVSASNHLYFDRYCTKEFPGVQGITQPMLEGCYTQRKTENKRSLISRCSPVIQLVKYLMTRGDENIHLPDMRRRANLPAVGKKRVYSGKYALSSIVYFAHRGDIYRRIKWNNRGYQSNVWRCVSRVEKDGPDCTARTVREDELHRAALTAVNDVLNRKDSFLPILKENIRAAL